MIWYLQKKRLNVFLIIYRIITKNKTMIKLRDILEEAIGEKYYNVWITKKSNPDKFYKKLDVKANTWQEAKAKIKSKYPPSDYIYEWNGYGTDA